MEKPDEALCSLIYTLKFVELYLLPCHSCKEHPTPLTVVDEFRKKAPFSWVSG